MRPLPEASPNMETGTPRVVFHQRSSPKSRTKTNEVEVNEKGEKQEEEGQQSEEKKEEEQDGFSQYTTSKPLGEVVVEVTALTKS